MSDSAEQRLKTRLEELVLTQTGRALGSRGTTFSIQRTGGRLEVLVKLGFPVERTRDGLAEALAEHCRSAIDEPVDFRIDWSVDTHAVQHGLKPIAGVKNVIAVASGKGGVGKSTIAVNLALALALEGAKVGVLDADIYGPSQPRMLGLAGRRPESRDGKTLEPLCAHGVQAMSIGFLVDERQPMAWRGPMVTSALNQLLAQTNWRDVDYLVVDMPPGTGDIQLTLSQRVPVSGAVIVTTPQDIALADARKGIEMFQKVNVQVLGIVENMSLHVCSSCGHEEPIFGEHGGERLAAEYGVPLLGALPLERRVREETDSGTPSAAADPDGPVGARFRQLALRAAGELAAGGKDYSRLFPKITVEDE